jgi:hypothetical protein
MTTKQDATVAPSPSSLLLPLALTALLAIAGCKKVTDKDDPVVTTGGGTGTVTVGTANETDGFAVTLCRDKDGSTCDPKRYLTHKAGDKDTPCKLDSTATVGTTLQCVADAEELEFYFHGGHLAYNVPPSMCEYFLMYPYFYWNFKPGDGATTITYDTDKFGVIGVDSNNDGTVDAAASDVLAYRAAAGVGLEYDGIDNGTPKCTWNYTSIDGAPNCCAGSYQLIARSWNSSLNAYEADPVKEVKWGGKYGNCVDGPGKDQPRDFDFNMPKHTIWDVSDVGANDAYEIKAPIKAHGGILTNVYAANYFETAQHGGSMPDPLDFSANGIRANPYYVFECLDRAHEVRAAIWLSIREWDAVADFNAYVANGTESGDWDRPGDQETNPNDPFGGAKFVNDYWDLYDYELDGNPFPQVIVH